MRKLFITLLTLTGASALLWSTPAPVWSDEMVMQTPEHRLPISRAAKLRTTQDCPPGTVNCDPDTVWVGHVMNPSWAARSTVAPFGLLPYPAGGDGPYKTGRGPWRVSPTSTQANVYAAGDGFNGSWDFDHYQATETDSLQGWWPLVRPFQSIGVTNFPDYRRAFMGFDYGNQANYVINQPTITSATYGGNARTFGVVGIWHRDRGSAAAIDSIPGKNVQPMSWSPTSEFGGTNTAVAWCGIRSSGDLTEKDLASNGGTNNPFSGELAEMQGNNSFNQVGALSPDATDHNFPGYGSQWDQMLFRDVAVTVGDNLNLAFDVQAVLSPSDNNSSNWRIGYFYKDPISSAQAGLPGTTATPTSDGNFISSSVAGTNAPRDSFMVYVGAPVNDAACLYSDGPAAQGGQAPRPVYDKQRRWFSEVIRINDNVASTATPQYKELYSTSGTVGPTNISRAVGSAVVNAILAEQGVTTGTGKVRFVFRVKTNRGFDDEDASAPTAAFNSGGKGAAMIDNVMITGSTAQVWTAADGNFEASNSIDNTLTLVSGSLDASGAWHSTGKPPAIYFHVHNVSTLLYADPCGVVSSPNRQCNLTGNVVTGGDHNNVEKLGGAFGANDQDRAKWITSPTINLLSGGNGSYNAQGIDAEVANVTEFSLVFSLYNGGLKGNVNGNFFSIGYQAYPGKQKNGNLNWGDVQTSGSIFSYGATACFETFFLGAKANSLVKSIRPLNQPDSLRVFLQQIARCFTTTLSGSNCSPTILPNQGAYFDNLSMALIDGGVPPVPISVNIWDWIMDAFPVNGNSAQLTTGGLGGVGIAFDTCAAQVRIAYNIGLDGSGTPSRINVGGDSTPVTTSVSPNQRLDMIFRVLPGPGDYVNVGNRTSGVARRPDGTVGGGIGRVKAIAADVDNGGLPVVERWWGAYINNNGVYGSSGGHPSGEWSEHVWNSARCDTVEKNIFPAVLNSANLSGIQAGVFATMLHEGDASSEDLHKATQLGITKNRCFLINPAAGQPNNSTNITCTGVPAPYTSGAGYNGTATTTEYTKILPDGLFTAGSHIEYWFRRSASDTVPSGVSFVALPDTQFVFSFETDGKRWQEFSVLPDRWKAGNDWGIAYNHGNAMACMLVYDLNDRRGDELIWVSVADTIGATSSARRGAHNGWRARGDQDITVGIASDPTIAVYAHGGQPGTIWDMFQHKAAESGGTAGGGIGSRLATTPVGLNAGKQSYSGPTGDMLRQWYKTILIIAGDVNQGLIGPYADRGDGDVALLQDFANTSAGGTSLPRNIWLEGRGFAESQASATTGHPTFCATYFGAGFVNGNYRTFSNNPKDIPDLTPQGVLAATDFVPATGLGNPPIYGVNSNCFIQNDVLNINTAVTGAVVGALYEPGILPTYVASVYAPAGGANHPSNTLLDGWRIVSLGGRNSLTTGGLMNWYGRNIASLWGGMNCSVALGTPVGVGDNPNGSFINFMSLQSENPMRSGHALISFGITRTEKVELKIYDVTGRLVRTLANRVFKANEAQQVIWDGTNDSGDTVASGVYFYQIRTPSFVSQKKLAVLRR